MDGGEAKVNKYSAERIGKYASKHEAEVAASLAILERVGKIRELREQVRIVLGRIDIYTLQLGFYLLKWKYVAKPL